MHDGSVPAPIRLAIVDDHPLIAAAIQAAVAADAVSGDRVPPRRPIRLVGTARTVGEGLALVDGPGTDAPDVILCDIEVAAEADGLRVVEAAAAAGRRAIVLTSHDRSSFMREAFALGAVGFVPKSADVAQILEAVRVVADGGTAFPATVIDAVRNARRVPSERERAVLALLRGGASNDEIGATLGISSRTVESHLRRLFDRYGVLSRTELVVLAIDEGWVRDCAV